MKRLTETSTLIGLGLTAILLVVGVAASADEPATLDGTSVEISFTDPSGESGPDTLQFADGQFESVGCREWGFTAADYTAVPVTDGIQFDAIATSESEGTMTWNGVVSGETASGTAVWTKEGQDAITYTF